MDSISSQDLSYTACAASPTLLTLHLCASRSSSRRQFSLGISMAATGCHSKCRSADCTRVRSVRNDRQPLHLPNDRVFHFFAAKYLRGSCDRVACQAFQGVRVFTQTSMPPNDEVLNGPLPKVNKPTRNSSIQTGIDTAVIFGYTRAPYSASHTSDRVRPDIKSVVHVLCQ